jgi:hypothetical protein
MTVVNPDPHSHGYVFVPMNQNASNHHTDTSFGFDIALGVATDAIDRLHSK